MRSTFYLFVKFVENHLISIEVKVPQTHRIMSDDEYRIMAIISIENIQDYRQFTVTFIKQILRYSILGKLSL